MTNLSTVNDQTTDIANPIGSDAVTAGSNVQPELISPDQFDAEFNNGNDIDWSDNSSLPPPKAKVLTPISWALIGLLVGIGGFAGGASIGKSHAPKAVVSTRNGAGAGGAAAVGRTGAAAGATAAAGTGRTAGGAATAGGATTGAAAGGSAGNGATTGTVQLVDGNNVYIQDNQGTVIKVIPTATAAITVNKVGTPADFKPGDTIIVQGTADATTGNIAATSIGSSTGGFGRGGNGGGGGNVGGATAGAAAPAGTGTGTGAAATGKTGTPTTVAAAGKAAGGAKTPTTVAATPPTSTN